MIIPKSISTNSNLIQWKITTNPPSFFTYIVLKDSPSDSQTWDEFLKNKLLEGAPLPLSDGWEQITAGLKLEIMNIDCDPSLNGYWIASIIKVVGYYALLRYEGYINDESHDFWINLANPDIHEVGWSSANNYQIIPPRNIQENIKDWKQFLLESLVGAKTLPSSFHQKLFRCFGCDFKLGMKLEALDKNDISSMRPCYIDKIIGQRLHLSYLDPGTELEKANIVSFNGHQPFENLEGFWCHMNSPLIHPVGWSTLIGHKITADQAYLDASKEIALNRKYNDDYASPELFFEPKQVPLDCKFEVGMKLETRDAVNLSSICVATIKQVLNEGYIMISIDGAPVQLQNLFCYHVTSPYLFPAGWCKTNGIELTPPRDYFKIMGTKKFDWNDYLSKTKSISIPDIFERDGCPVPVAPDVNDHSTSPDHLTSADSSISKSEKISTLPEESASALVDVETNTMVEENSDTRVVLEDSNPTHSTLTPTPTLSPTPPTLTLTPTKIGNPFKPGMKLEAVDLMEPHLICPATIAKCVGRLIRIHFDGWESWYDQWVDCCSTDIYAAGWCELTHYKLEKPPESDSAPESTEVPATTTAKVTPTFGTSIKKKNVNGQTTTNYEKDILWEDEVDDDDQDFIDYPDKDNNKRHKNTSASSKKTKSKRKTR